MTRIRLARFSMAALAINGLLLMTGCNDRFLDAIQSGFFGWISATTAALLSSAVPIGA